MKKVLAIVGGVALMAALAAPQKAQANLLTNGSLETTLAADRFDLVTATTTQNTNALAGWTITSGSVDVVPNTYWQSSLGTYSVDMVGSPGIGSISQTVSTVIGDNYLMTFDLAIDPEMITGEIASMKHLVVTATSSSLAVDGTQTFSGTAGTTTKLNMQYLQQTFAFTATSTSTTLSLVATLPTGLPGTFTASSVFAGPVIDNLDLEDTGSSQPPVPEPASLGLLGLGAIGLLRRRSNRRA